MSNIKFQNAILRKPQAVPPIWFMRQAGRYHAHYQNLRSKYSFMDLCKNPDLAAEVAMGPIEEFDFDVSILFSDLLFPLEALGMGLKYEPSPELGWHLTRETLPKLKASDVALSELQFQKAAVQETRKRLPKEKSLIGFVGGPWTLHVYAVEGGHAGNLISSKSDPWLFEQFSEILVPLLIENIRLQLEGGAELVMIFDTAAGECDPIFYQKSVVPKIEKMARSFPGKIGYYSRGTQPTHLSAPFFQEKVLAGVGVDWRWNLPELLKTPGTGFVQGNFDQALLFMKPKEFKSRLMEYLEPFIELTPDERAGWVCGLGHGVLPATPIENVRSFVKTVREVFG